MPALLPARPSASLLPNAAVKLGHRTKLGSCEPRKGCEHPQPPWLSRGSCTQDTATPHAGAPPGKARSQHQNREGTEVAVQTSKQLWGGQTWRTEGIKVTSCATPRWPEGGPSPGRGTCSCARLSPASLSGLSLTLFHFPFSDGMITLLFTCHEFELNCREPSIQHINKKMVKFDSV